MKILLVTPAPLRFNNGNRITAVRWARMLRRLGHRIDVDQEYKGKPCDLMIALHARRSFKSIQRFHEAHPTCPLIVVLTGTDLYRDIHTDANAKHSLEAASRIVVLQRQAFVELPKRLHPKTRVIYQSANPCKAKPLSSENGPFKVCVVGHLRPEKDPLRTALAVRELPATSRVQVVHIGRALSDTLKRAALAETRRNPRYRWIGELPHWKTRRALVRSHLMSLTSVMEGSSNVLCEAIACSVPVVASRIPGLIGTLGADYPGYFPVGSTRALTKLLRKVESNGRFYQTLKRRCTRLRPLVEPKHELAAWKALLDELG